MEVTLSVFGTFVRFVDMGSTWVNLLCYPFIGIHVGEILDQEVEAQQADFGLQK